MNKLKGTIGKTPKLGGKIKAQIVTVGTGEDGATFIPAVSEDGVISWTNDKGLENPKPVNIKGPNGEDYVLTEADKEEIAEMAAEKVDIPDIAGGKDVFFLELTETDGTNLDFGGEENFEAMVEAYNNGNAVFARVNTINEGGEATQIFSLAVCIGEAFGFIAVDGLFVTTVVVERETAYKSSVDLVTPEMLPTRVSQLNNDAEYVTETELTAKGYQTKTEAANAYQPKGSYATTEQLSATEKKIPTKNSQLENDSGYLKGFTETDPTVPSWAKQASKPSYTKSEVGLGNVANERQYSASNPPPYPVTSVNGSTGAVEVEPKGTAATKVTNHNADDKAHNDIRLTLSALTKKVNDLLDSDDTTLDQMSEVVAYIKANRELLESYTTEKVNVADIIDNLTTSVSDKPLSAKQGVQLKALIDAIKVPTALSQLTGDSTHRTVTDSEKAAWNAKSDFSGEYGDLKNKPTKVTDFTNDAGYQKTTEADNKYQPKGSYLTEIPSGYVTDTELAAKGYQTAAQVQEAVDNAGYIEDCAVFYGVCSTEADVAAKTVTVDKFELKTGAFVIVKFTDSNSASNPTLNVNGTGAKPIYRYGTTVASTGTTTTGWTAGAVQMFVYDGNGWIRDYWNNTTYSNAGLGQGYGTCSTAAATAAKAVTLSSYTLTAGGIVAVKFTNDVPASATMNINSKGAKNIYHHGAAIKAGVIKAGDIATFIYSSQYHLLAVDRQADIATEEWTFTLEDGSTVTKAVCVR